MSHDSGLSARTEFGRKPERGSHERSDFNAVVDAARVGHLGYVVDGRPYVLPVGFARDGEALVFHGSTGARPFRLLAEGAPCCFTVTHVDGLVLARSANDSSMNYRSAVVLGNCEAITEETEKWRILDVITDHLLPGRRASLRPMTRKEVAATLVLRLPIVEFSVKSRSGGPGDEGADIDFPVWSGVMPVVTSFGTPIPAANMDPAIPEPEYLRSWRA
ncbi:MAG: pyridoxamine 5'-phosphate oxidase family protein [Candidatus Nanopelagicales bacterium]